MPIDPSIALGVRAPQFESPVNSLMQVLQAQHMKQSVDADQRQAEEYQRGVAGENRLAQLLASGSTPDQVAAGLAQAGYGKQALAYTKQQQDLAKAKADVDHLGAQTGKLKSDTATADYDLREKKRQKAITDIASFTSPEQAMSSLALHEQAGDLTPDAAAAVRATIPQNPSDFPKWQIGMLQRIMNAHDIVNANETARHNGATEKTSAGQLAVSQGQLTVAQQREKREASAPKGQVVQSDDGPILVDPRTGTGKAIIGPDGQRLAGVTKPLNDSQSKALLFGTRMQEANSILNDLGSKGVNSSIPGSRTPGIGSIVNSLSDADHQKLDQAKRDFLNATLRRESGAAISPGEFENGDKQYFPQVGDSAAVIAQKARNRDLAARGVLIEVPEKQRGSLAPSKPAAPAGVPSVNAKGWVLHTDAHGNRAYVSPDGKSYEEVK